MNDGDRFEITCPRCQKRLRIKTDLAGHPIRCPNASCLELIQVPERWQPYYFWFWVGASFMSAVILLLLGFSIWWLIHDFRRSSEIAQAKNSSLLKKLDEPPPEPVQGVASIPDQKPPVSSTINAQADDKPWQAHDDLQKLQGLWKQVKSTGNTLAIFIRFKGGLVSVQHAVNQKDGSTIAKSDVVGFELKRMNGKLAIAPKHHWFLTDLVYKIEGDLLSIEHGKCTLNAQYSLQGHWKREVMLALDVPPDPPATDKKVDTSSDSQKLQGTWKLAQVVWADEKAKNTIPIGSFYQLVVNGNDMAVQIDKQGGQRSDAKYRFELDETRKNPRSYKKTRTDGADQGEIETGIYSLAGDTLSICFNKSGGVPTDFVIERGPNAEGKCLYVFQRATASTSLVP